MDGMGEVYVWQYCVHASRKHIRMNPPLNGSSAVWLVLIRCNLLSLSSGFQLSTFCAGWCLSAAIFFLSPQEIQLPFFRVHWYFCAVIFFLSPQGFQLPFY